MTTVNLQPQGSADIDGIEEVKVEKHPDTSWHQHVHGYGDYEPDPDLLTYD
jgi:hypothetical protein